MSSLHTPNIQKQEQEESWMVFLGHSQTNTGMTRLSLLIVLMLLTTSAYADECNRATPDVTWCTKILCKLGCIVYGLSNGGGKVKQYWCVGGWKGGVCNCEMCHG
uniref:Knottin scorpion toxin-like domain-containing protein n=1 Tax=Oryza brachyantha TaxID=4533 RepID=J3N1V8_ORYBR